MVVFHDPHNIFKKIPQKIIIGNIFIGKIYAVHIKILLLLCRIVLVRNNFKNKTKLQSVHYKYLAFKSFTQKSGTPLINFNF